MTGSTQSADFPTTAGAFQATFGGLVVDAFVTKFDPTGSALAYSTYLGRAGDDLGAGIAVDALGSAYITGETSSALFPTTPGAFQTSLAGARNAFVSRLNPTGSALVYSTYLGGSILESGTGIAIDVVGNAYVTGLTHSADFPTTPGAFQSASSGDIDAFATKLNPSGSAVIYSTYVGGSGIDVSLGIAVDGLGRAHLTGRTDSGDFPATPRAFQTSGGESIDAFVTKLDPTGSDLIYSTYLGGNAGDLAASDIAAGIALDALGNAYVAGWTFSRDFPVTPGAFQSSMGGIVDAFVAKITDLAVPAPPPVTVGKVTGGGSIHLGNDVGTFGFAVQRKPQDGPITGNLQYIDHATGARVRAVTFTSLAITGNIASFEGTCTRNRIPCTFAVTVTDHGEPGTNDRFVITVSSDPPEGGVLRGGNIRIHERV